MSRTLLKASLFFLAALLMSAPAWGLTPADTGPAVSAANLTADTGADLPDLFGAGVVLAKGNNGRGHGRDNGDRDQDKDGDRDGDKDRDQDRDCDGSGPRGPGDDDDDNEGHQDGNTNRSRGDRD